MFRWGKAAIPQDLMEEAIEIGLEINNPDILSFLLRWGEKEFVTKTINTISKHISAYDNKPETKKAIIGFMFAHNISFSATKTKNEEILKTEMNKAINNNDEFLFGWLQCIAKNSNANLNYNRIMGELVENEKYDFVPGLLRRAEVQITPQQYQQLWDKALESSNDTILLSLIRCDGEFTTEQERQLLEKCKTSPKGIFAYRLAEILYKKHKADTPAHIHYIYIPFVENIINELFNINCFLEYYTLLTTRCHRLDVVDRKCFWARVWDSGEKERILEQAFERWQFYDLNQLPNILNISTEIIPQVVAYLENRFLHDGYLPEEHVIRFFRLRNVQFSPGYENALIASENERLVNPGLAPHTASNLSQTVNEQLKKIKEELNAKFPPPKDTMLTPEEDLTEKFSPTQAIILTSAEVLQFARKCLEACLPHGYLLESLKEYSELNLSDDTSKKTISYAAFLCRSEEQYKQPISYLVLRHLLENLIANKVNKWDPSEQEALECFLMSLPKESLKTNVNVFKGKGSCAPGVESRSLLFAGRLMNKDFKHEIREAFYSERVIEECRKVLEMTFDIELFLHNKPEIKSWAELEEQASIFLSSLMQKREPFIVSMEVLVADVKLRIEKEFADRTKESTPSMEIDTQSFVQSEPQKALFGAVRGAHTSLLIERPEGYTEEQFINALMEKNFSKEDAERALENNKNLLTLKK